MGGWVEDGRMDGRMDEWMGGWVEDGWGGVGGVSR